MKLFLLLKNTGKPCIDRAPNRRVSGQKSARCERRLVERSPRRLRRSTALQRSWTRVQKTPQSPRNAARFSNAKKPYLLVVGKRLIECLKFIAGYGMTEAMIKPSNKFPAKPGSSGFLLPNCKAKVSCQIIIFYRVHVWVLLSVAGGWPGFRTNFRSQSEGRAVGVRSAGHERISQQREGNCGRYWRWRVLAHRWNT